MRASSLLLAPVIAGLLLSGTVSHIPERPAARPVPVEVEPPFVPNMPPVEAAPVNTPLASRFEATTDHGRIGIWDEYTVDEAADNLFHIHLDRLPTEGEAVWLEYELIGISSHDAVPRSINHALAIGGGVAESSDHWTQQRERISPNSLHLGRNSVWFHAPQGPVEGYEVRDVRIVLGEALAQSGIVLTNTRCANNHGQVYVKGLLIGAAGSATQLTAEGQALVIQDGAFAGTIAVDYTAAQIHITALLPNGEVVEQTFPISARNGLDITASSEEAVVISEAVQMATGGHLEVAEATLDIPAQALKNDVRITAIALPARDVPPAGQELINVCRNGAGYRFLPDGTTFNLPVGITLPFDTARIPPGYGPEDVRTFYFDEDQRRWLALPKDSVQPEDARVRSRTTHFTDYINGIIQLPESPETMGYTPTSIKDYKAGDVSAGITPIAPPQASNTGAVTTRFPLKLPQGRQGMQPDLAIQYNSEGGNGWMGLGWNLSTPSITIETRWGVPRYSASLETETYLLDGEMMSPVAHRAEWEDRSSPKVFHTRVEGAFRKIERLGTAPADCYWKVTDKDGTARYYGGDQDGLDNSALLRIGSDTSAIAKWMLRRVVDSNGNTITYTYDTVVHAGTDGSPNLGRQIYPKLIQYTGREGGNEGPYSVEFDFDTTGRADKQINCRLGFKEVTANLLRRVDVKYSDVVVRSYHLHYTEGAFNKTLLDSIVEYDANGDRFYGHEMGYYDDVRQGGEYIPLDDQVDWDTEDDGVRASMVFDDEPLTALGGSGSSNLGFGTSVTVGPPGPSSKKTWTIGGHFSHTRSNGYTLLAIADINGDNLPDKVYKQDDSIKFRPNLRGQGVDGFGDVDAINLEGIGGLDLMRSQTRSNAGGFEANPEYFSVGTNGNWAKTLTTDYLLDRNGDGLMDFATGGRVFFNYRTDLGVQTTSLLSSATDNPITQGDTLMISAVEPGEMALLDSINPLHDVVRTWIAPYAGIVTITSTVALQGDLSEVAQQYADQDGVYAVIEHVGDRCFLEVPWEPAFTPVSHNCWTTRQVQEGDAIFFRLQSVWDGAYDKVRWSPTVRYLSVEDPQIVPSALLTPFGPNMKDLYEFNAGEAFVLSGDQDLLMPLNGTIHIDSLFTKPFTSDSVRLTVIRYDSDGILIDTLVHHHFGAAPAVLSLNDSFAVDSTNIIRFRLTSPTNVDWAALHWFPRLYYSQADWYSSAQLFAPDTGEPLLVFYPTPYLSMYNRVVSRSHYFETSRRIPRPVIANGTGQITITPQVTYGQLGDFDGDVTLSVKAPGRMLGRRTMRYDGGAFSGVGDLIVDVEENDTLYIEYHVSDERMFFDTLQVWLDAVSLDGIDVSEFTDVFGVWTRFDSTDRKFGELHRNWGAFAYNYKAADDDLDPLDNIDDSILDLSFNQVSTTDVEGADEDNLSGFDDPTQAPFIYMWADMERPCWRGYDDLTYVRGDSVSSSRMGEDDMDFSIADVTDQSAAQAPIKASKSRTFGATVGASAGFIGASASWSSGSTRTLLDAIDLNGDRYPDIVGANEIQSTLPTGGMEGHTWGYSGGPVSSSVSSLGVAASGSYSLPKPTSSGGGGVYRSASGKMSISLGQSGDSPCTAKSMIGVSGSANATTSKDECTFTWLDMNGDGLPDKVKRDTVWLNTGYGFLDGEHWGADSIQFGYAFDVGLGGGISLYNGSVQAGLATSQTKSNSKIAIIDVTGDGIPDIVEADTSGGGNVRVQVNRGNGFEAAIPWSDVATLDASESEGESMNAAFTFCINFVFVRICFNPNANYGRGASKSSSQFTDINGDSYPDFLRSSEEGSLEVFPSTIRRTNLLKAVHSPFGAKWQVDYEVAGNTYDLPQSKWVMKELLVWDGFQGDGPDNSRTTFEYVAGQYDRRERETYGFGEVRTHEWDTEASDDDPYRTTVQTYDVSGYYTKGLPLVKTVQDGQANKFIETENTYALKLLDGTDAPDTYNATNDFGSAFPALVRTEERFFEGQASAGITKAVTFRYDPIGNVTRYADLGYENQDDSVVAVITYHNLEDPYIKSTPENITVTVGGEIRRVRNQFINQTNGNVDSIQQTIDDETLARYELYYTEEGNLDSLVRPTNYKGQRMHYGYTYDDVVKTYVTEVRDAYGYRSNSTYEYRFGQLESTTDMNGEVTNYTIDDRGRVETVIGPYEVASGAPYTIKLEYFLRDSLPYSVVTHYDPEHPEGDGIRTVTFLDGLFRPLQVKKSAVIREENGDESEAWIASGRVKFDPFGRTVESWYPTDTVIAAPPGAFVAHFDTEDPTTTTFDILDRELVTTLPDASTTSRDYSIDAANGGPMAFKTRVTDALFNKKDSYTDVREREIARVDHGPNGEILTTFRYNAIGELLEVNDDEENVTSYTYDQLGRKLTYDHPDGGLTEFTYDPAGNLLTKNTANLREMFPDGGPIKYSYHYQRVDTINYPRNFMNQVVYTYGDSTESEYNRIGRVKLQLDGSGGQEFFYGPLGEVEKTIRTIVVSQTDIRTFVSEERYDTWNRIQVMKFPDGDSVDYAYNTAGKLKRVTSTKDNFDYDVVDDIGYDKFEQRIYMKHGNDVETRYTYEPDRRRLSTLRVDQPNGTRIMDNVYGYDQVNNVLSLVNQRSVPGDGQGGPMVSTYQYDNLYRLTDATGNYTGSAREDAYTLHMQYDDLHNITHKIQTHSSTFPTATLSNYDFEYAYEGEAPHTPSQVGYRAYDYDANGNLTTWDEDAPRMGTRSLAWDEENRLQAVNDAGYVSQYTYDAGGERVLKSHGGMDGVFINGAPVGLINHRDNYTIYVSPYLVHAERGFTKHYYIEGQRVASRTGNGHFITGPMPTNGITAGEVNFASRFQAMQQAGQQQVVNNAPTPGVPTLGGYNGQPEISGNPTYLNNIGTYAAPDPNEGWPMPPVPPGAPGTPPTTPIPTVTNETVTAGYAFVTDANAAEMNRYFFHPDHLGSSSYITGTDGTARQHLEYMAFGEVFVEEQNAADPLDYLFNGKELDRVTGLYYYGARYYDPVASMWASVDPMAEKHPHISPLAYTLHNPVNLIDPTGMTEEGISTIKATPSSSPFGPNEPCTVTPQGKSSDSPSLLKWAKDGVGKIESFFSAAEKTLEKGGDKKGAASRKKPGQGVGIVGKAFSIVGGINEVSDAKGTSGKVAKAAEVIAGEICSVVAGELAVVGCVATTGLVAPVCAVMAAPIASHYAEKGCRAATRSIIDNASKSNAKSGQYGAGSRSDMRVWQQLSK